MLSFESLKKIISRQARFEWGDEYTPSNLATTREGSRISRISRLNSGKLGRYLHLQSSAETAFAKLALYHPRVFDIHEQKMLFPTPHSHPLQGHPLAVGIDWPGVEGTITIARKIGFKHHTRIVDRPDGSRVHAPYPYVGDLLIYMTDEHGVPYAVNWNLKGALADFNERNRGKVKTPEQQNKSREIQRLRNELEEQYYLSAGIRTMMLAPECVDRILWANLDLTYSKHLHTLSIEESLLADFSCNVQEAVRIGTPVAGLAVLYGKRWGARDQFLTRIYQDIWSRRLLVDMFEPIRIDHPLAPQTDDPLDIFEHFFARVAG